MRYGICRRAVSLLAVFAAALLPAGTGYGRDDAPPIRVMVTADKQPLYIGERLTVTVTILNDGKEPIRVRETPHIFSYDELSLSIEGEATGPWRGRVGHSMKTIGERVPLREIGPRESYSVELSPYEDPGSAFVKPDVYQLRARLRVGERDVVSDKFLLVVRELPRLERVSSVEVEHQAQGGVIKQKIEVGLLPFTEVYGELLVVRRSTSAGEDRYREIPLILRLGRERMDAEIALQRSKPLPDGDNTVAVDLKTSWRKHWLIRVMYFRILEYQLSD